MPDPIRRASDLDDQEYQQLQEVVHHFESAWQMGSRPRVEEFLPPDPVLHTIVLVELVNTDLEFRLRAGEPARVEEYLARYPELQSDRTVLLDLISTEFRLRQRQEPDLTCKEYLDRFPSLGEELPGLLDTPSAPPSVERTTAYRPVPGRDALEAEEGPDIPGYRILGELGKGGMGLVYLAEQVALRRKVALKMVRAGTEAEAEELARFRGDAEAAAQLKHPHIAQIYEIGEQGGLPYFSLEYVEGGSLARKLAGTTLPAREAAQLLETMARAMHHAHRHHIIHRDLKPANVLLTADGQPKITDFGLAKRLDVDTGRTRSGAILGTPSYMAPEQAEGKVHELGPATDIYGLGAVLYEMLTGRPPFKAETVLNTLLQVISQDPVPPRRLQAALPRDLESICLKCLEKPPARRYASAQELAEDLRRFLDGKPTLARPAPAHERILKWARRRPAVAALVGFVAVAVLGLAGLFVWHNIDLQSQLAQARAQLREEELARQLEARRDEVQGLLLRGEAGADRQEWREAITLLQGALEQINAEPALADLRPDALRLLERARQQLTAVEVQRARADAHFKYRQFTQRRDRALFHATMKTGLSLADNLRATQEAAEAALALFGLSPQGDGDLTIEAAFSAEEKAEITAACHELLLVLAETTAQPLPDQAEEDRRRQAEQALQGKPSSNPL